MSLNKAYWYWNIEEGTLEGGDFFYQLFNLERSKTPISWSDVQEKFSEKDFEKLERSLNTHLESKGKTPFACETIHIDQVTGNTMPVLWFGEVIRFAADGSPLCMSGLAKKKIDLSSKKSLSKMDTFLFTRLMDHLNESIFFKDLDSRFIRINKECAKKFKLDDPKDAIGKTDFDIFGNEHATKAYNDEQHIIATEEPIFQQVERETLANEPDKVQWASTTKMPLYDDQGELMGTFGITRDVTDQKKLEEKLETSDQLFSKLSELAPGFLYLHHVDDKNNITFPFASEGIRDLFDLEPEDLKGGISPLMRRVHKDDLKRVLGSIMQSVKYVQEWNCEYRIIHPDKGLRWVRGKAKPELQKDGSVLSPGFLTDITEEKRTYEANEELKRQFQSVFNTDPNLIFVKDEAGRFIMANNAACTFFKKHREDLIGKTDFDLGVPEKRANKYLAADLKVIETEEPMFFPEIRTKLDTGDVLWHQTIKVPFHQGDSSTKAVLSIVTDITERKQKEMELSETLDIIGEQNQRLTNFAHIVSHNLRNHAGNIHMLLTLYDPNESEEEKEETFEFLKKASENLNESIADLNEIVDKQQKTLNQRKDVNFKKYIAKTKEILTTEIISNNVKIIEQVPDDLIFEYNPAYLESIILNMFSNAIKYRKPNVEPRIEVTAYEKKGRIYFEISDNGLGIDLEKHGKKLFGMYNTFHGNENAKGIGLFITKNQIEAMGGKIEVTSDLGKGTTFKIRLK